MLKYVEEKTEVFISMLSCLIYSCEHLMNPILGSYSLFINARNYFLKSTIIRTPDNVNIYLIVSMNYGRRLNLVNVVFCKNFLFFFNGKML